MTHNFNVGDRVVYRGKNGVVSARGARKGTYFVEVDFGNITLTIENDEIKKLQRG